MGVVRKTLSVGTLGLVPFRSKQEQLDRAEQAMLKLEEARELTELARARAETRASVAEHELKMSRRQRRKAETRSLLQAAAGAVEEVGHATAKHVDDLPATAKKMSKRARKRTAKAGKRAHATTEAVANRAHSVKDRIEHLVEA